MPARPYRELRVGQRDRHHATSMDGNNSRWFSQRVDHFSDSPETWMQRYFVNETFFRMGSGPVFLCVGGEGPPMTEQVVVTGENHCALMVHLARIHGALILALEHRYYGESHPRKDLSVENMRFLSSRQALEDIASFHSHIRSAFAISSKQRWITFGGSYPGMLAAWSHAKFPHLFHAAVSSSAPVQAILNMKGYNNVVASDFADETLGGSMLCLNTIKGAFAQVGEYLLSYEGRRYLKTRFSVCGGDDVLEDIKNRALFAETLSDPLIPQSNDPSCTSPLCDIRRQCKFLTDQSLGKPLDRLVAMMDSVRDGSCLDTDYQMMLAGLQDIKISEDRTDRTWFYQTCTEFGFYQTCDPDSRCPFVSSPHLNNVYFSTDMCKVVFNMSFEKTAEFVRESNNEYGGLNLQSYNIIFVNGGADPWKSQSMLHPSNAYVQTVMVKGASHHFWTHPELPTDSTEVKHARRIIAQFVRDVLAQKASHSERSRAADVLT
ncbi:hypothetical protein GUITHDRAFT_158798 [Guillardia theta CCMP2712]|uniref:Thymus-specific serine protease n=1 Tax=Guillardia theta (strain CCMP2712) TaxID=905079 RepID=L1IEY2_GUITC|nr:hypothetical protein GUITHDRAFT_158798 [Guillardia theta CCMP2712]EKX34652.1 hypothetical protein GUITHDRAFT_158798 [Guillardia theta CCMP2712]|eukprot:XP_005821632.1 hypothetical protein GUITHDRAFT_158798 [Guillardia theta CCMP2712]